jgi:hypothetical protein
MSLAAEPGAGRGAAGELLGTGRIRPEHERLRAAALAGHQLDSPAEGAAGGKRQRKAPKKLVAEAPSRADPRGPHTAACG